MLSFFHFVVFVIFVIQTPSPLTTCLAPFTLATVLELSPELLKALPDGAFDRLLNMPGTVHREIANRRTVEFELEGGRYFVKVQRGCGWGEIFKNIVSGRLPVVSARTEWSAIEATHLAGIATLRVVGKGLRGVNPARVESFVVTQALEGTISLEQLTAGWGRLPKEQRVALKRVLIGEVAAAARKLHQAGLNHRDFYLCHFLVRDRDWAAWNPGEKLELVLIDLHRMQQRNRVPHRWLVKDLGGLLFSALDAGLTRRDLFRFLKTYCGDEWRSAFAKEATLWKLVCRNAATLSRPFHHREPPLRLD